MNKSIHLPPESVFIFNRNRCSEWPGIRKWVRLIGYLDDGTYPIDNNLAENAIRPFAIRQENWLFANSQAGAKASVNLYSLVQTAKANDLNLYDYLK